MDWVSIKEQGLEGLKKYRYLLLILLAGIFLMAIPGKEAESPQVSPTVPVTEPGLEESLSALLCKIEGAGKTEVLLTEAEGIETLYQMDEDRTLGENTTDITRKTVLTANSGRGEAGLIRQINPPVYQGAIVLCRGAGDPRVKLAIVEAVSSVTGLTTDKITVLKMK